MKILITGGSGLIGKKISEKLRARNHQLVYLSRKANHTKNIFRWDPAENFVEEQALDGIDGIIHLAGATIAKRWTENYRKELYSSRVNAAELLLAKLKERNQALSFFISASGINYYGTFTSAKILSETDGILKRDFLAQLCENWEKAASNFAEIGARSVCLRTAMVLAKDGGSFPLLKKITDFNLASAIGNGMQWINWIHLEDMAEMYVFAIENRIEGAYNAVADGTLTQADFMRKLAAAERNIFLPVPVPAVFLKILTGEMSSILLEGSRASNEKIKKAGFSFSFKKIEEAFQDLVADK